MLESLVINGKLYQSIDEVALFVDQPEAYIEQLARGKWIDASFVHGHYFVDTESLVRFLMTEKSERDAVLAEQLKREEAAAAVAAYSNDALVREASPGIIVVLKTGVVVACGLLIALVSWSAADAGLTAASIRSGAASVIQAMHDHVVGGGQN